MEIVCYIFTIFPLLRPVFFDKGFDTMTVALYEVPYELKGHTRNARMEKHVSSVV